MSIRTTSKSGDALEDLERFGPALGDRHVGAASLEERRHREDVADVVVDDEDPSLLRRHRLRPPISSRVAVGRRTPRDDGIDEDVDGRWASERSRWLRHRCSVRVRRTSIFAGDGDDRERREPLDRADGSDGLVAIHDRHHDVHQDDVDVGRPLQGGERIGAALGDDDARHGPVRGVPSSRRCCGSRRRRRGPSCPRRRGSRAAPGLAGVGGRPACRPIASAATGSDEGDRRLRPGAVRTGTTVACRRRMPIRRKVDGERAALARRARPR